MTARDKIFLDSELLDNTEEGYKCRICGALCKTPGDGHAYGCMLDAVVSEVAPKESAEQLLERLRVEALGRLSGKDIDKCHELANLLVMTGPAGVDDILEKVAEFCGREAVNDGVLRGFSMLDACGASYQQIETRLMCERMWFLEAAKQPVTPPVK